MERSTFSRNTAIQNDTRDVFELMGLIPAKEDYSAKFGMVCFELCRMHSKQQDFRNAYRIMTTCIEVVISLLMF